MVVIIRILDYEDNGMEALKDGLIAGVVKV